MSKTLDLSKLTPDEKLYIQAKSAYYKGEPIMEDPEFDILEDRLRMKDSFVVDIVGELKIKGNKVTVSKSKIPFVKHLTQMLSLAKIQFKPNYVPFKEFTNWLNTAIHAIVEFTPKLDGNAINIIYINGKLDKILSRGDGEEGQDYTEVLRHSVPTFIKNFTGEIRGEAVIDINLFNSTYGPNSNADKKYANARNYVAGKLNAQDKKACEDFDVVAFHIVDYTGNTLKQLNAWGFTTINALVTCSALSIDQNKFQEIHNTFKKYRETSKYQLDGYVAKFDESTRDNLGANGHHPHWALAIKFEAEVVTTTVVDIEWSIGKRGQLSPVAILDPVNLMGSVVTRASIYNADWMMNNKCYIGAEVSLIKSGDIIPKIVEITKESSNPVALPQHWNGHLVTFDGVNLNVDGFENTPEYKSLMLHHSIVALGIENIGPATASKIAESGVTLNELLSTNPDGLRMKLTQSGVFKDGRELEILIESVFKITSVELWKVIYAMGYRNCGRTISKQLANWLVKVPHDFKGLQKSVIESFVLSQDKQNEVKELVGILLANNVNVIKPEQVKAGTVFYECTGSPEADGFKTKKAFEAEVSKYQTLHTSLNKDTHYLVTDSMQSTSAKMAKANKYGVKIVTYKEFIQILESTK